MSSGACHRTGFHTLAVFSQQRGIRRIGLAVAQLELGEVVKAAWIDDCHRQAGSLQRHRQVQVVNACGFQHHAGHREPLEPLDQCLMPLVGLAKLRCVDNTPSTPLSHCDGLCSNIHTNKSLHGFTSTDLCVTIITGSPTSHFLPLQPCDAKSTSRELASGYSTQLVMRRGANLQTRSLKVSPGWDGLPVTLRIIAY